MRNRIFRLLVCLVLVCVILVNCSPIRAQAVEPVTMMIGAGIVIAAAVIGLGVMMGSDPLVFDELVSKVASHEKMADIISVDFKLPVIRYNATTGGIDPNGMSWALSVLVLETIREILFEEEAVVDSTVPSGYALYNNVLLPSLDRIASNSSHSMLNYKALVQVEYSDGVSYVLVTSDSAPIYDGSRLSFSGSSCQCVVFYVKESTSYWSVNEAGVFPSYHSICPTELIWASWGICDSSGSVIMNYSPPVFGSSVSVLEGLSAGEIAPQSQTILEGYPSWSSGSLIDENQNYWYPIGIGQTYDETKTYTQEQVQSGESTYQEEDTGTDEDSDAVTATGLKKWISDFKSSVDMWFARVSLNVSNTYDAVTEGLSGLGQGIANLPSAILSGIYDFFVPSAEAMAVQQDKWTALLSDRFGAVYDSVALIDNIAGAFTLGATQTQIRFPLVTIPFGDVNWEFGGWMVDVVPDGFEVLVDALKVGIDILCTLAFVNAMKSRLNRVLEGPA